MQESHLLVCRCFNVWGRHHKTRHIAICDKYYANMALKKNLFAAGLVPKVGLLICDMVSYMHAYLKIQMDILFFWLIVAVQAVGRKHIVMANILCGHIKITHL